MIGGVITHRGRALRRSHRLRTSSEDEQQSTLVIFSLSVISEAPIGSLASYQTQARPHQITNTHFHYDIGKVSFEEGEWRRRVDLLDDAIGELLDRLDGTDVTPEELFDPGVFVRAFLTLPPGAETIRASLIQRLGSVNATLWIDA